LWTSAGTSDIHFGKLCLTFLVQKNNKIFYFGLQLVDVNLQHLFIWLFNLQIVKADRKLQNLQKIFRLLTHVNLLKFEFATVEKNKILAASYDKIR
jgi:hypothetical protein